MNKRAPIINRVDVGCEYFGSPALNTCEECLLWAACVRYQEKEEFEEFKRGLRL